MPAIFMFDLTLAALCIVHAHQTGQERYWMFVVLMFPFVGSLIYVGMVFIPSVVDSRDGNRAISGLRNKMHPTRYLEAAEHMLSMARTPEHLFLYGEALADLNRYEDADVVLRELAQNPVYAEYPKFLLLYAKVHVWLRRYDEALATLDRYGQFSVSSTQGPALVLCSYAHEGLKDFDRAEAVYRESLDKIGGEEFRYHYGEYLIRRDRLAEARQVFQQVVTRSSHMTRQYRQQEREWIKKARQQLKLIAA